MYRFTDASGSVHLVRGLNQVPAEYRELAADLSQSARGTVSQVETRIAGHRWSDYEPDFNPNRLGVILYSSESCGACARAREHLNTRRIRYELRDIHADPGAWDEVAGILGRVVVPLLVIDGAYLSGYDPAAMDRMIDRRS